MTVRENCFHVVVGVILFNLICNMIIFLKENCSDLLTPPRGQGCVNVRSVCLHDVVVYFIPLNLIFKTNIKVKKST